MTKLNEQTGMGIASQARNDAPQNANQMVEQGICQRTLTVDLRWQKDGNGNLWFVAKDVCDMLGLTNVTTALQSLDDDEKDLMPKKSLGIENEKGQQEVNIISESGMYALIMRSNKEEARRFRKWVTSEVLPSIRKKGFFGDMKLELQLREEVLREYLRRGFWMRGEVKRCAEMTGIKADCISGFMNNRRNISKEELDKVLSWLKERDSSLQMEIDYKNK